MPGLLEDERERVVEALPGAKPDVLARPHVDIRLEHVRQGRARFRIGAVGGDDQIVLAIAIGALDLGVELQGDAQFTRAVLKDCEQAFATDAAEAVARRACDSAEVEDGDVVPVHERALDRGRAVGIARLEVGERLVRQHHAPPERIGRPIALDDHDLVIGVAALHRDRKVETGRSPAEAGDAHISFAASHKRSGDQEAARDDSTSVAKRRRTALNLL